MPTMSGPAAFSNDNFFNSPPAEGSVLAPLFQKSGPEGVREVVTFAQQNGYEELLNSPIGSQMVSAYMIAGPEGLLAWQEQFRANVESQLPPADDGAGAGSYFAEMLRSLQSDAQESQMSSTMGRG